MRSTVAWAAALAGVTLGLAVAGCAEDEVRQQPDAVAYVPAPETKIVIIREDFSEPFDVESGDRLDVILLPQGDPERRCGHMGGTYVLRLGQQICEGVDF